MSRRRGALLAAGVTALAALVGAAVWAARPEGNDTAAASPGPHNGRFHVDCGFSHAAPDDPIVFPDEPGASHLHLFFGATEVDASSTAETMGAGDTTCVTRQDRASYWAPALIEDGEPLDPIGSTAYYRAAPGVEPTAVEPFPFGLMMLAGDPAATEPQPTGQVGWSCTVEGVPEVTPPARCVDQVLLQVVFPDCWDGDRLDSPDHRAHMARSTDEGCPDSHPVALPQLEFHVVYAVPDGSADLRLASGSIYTGHADFVNAWDPEKLAQEVATCIHEDAYC